MHLKRQDDIPDDVTRKPFVYFNSFGLSRKSGEQLQSEALRQLVKPMSPSMN